MRDEELVAEPGARDQEKDGEGRDRWRNVHAPEIEVLPHGEIEELVPVELVCGEEVGGRVYT